MSDAVYLMDASAFIHRAFHAIRNLRAKDGRPTGAVYGFAATLLKLLKDRRPEYLAVVFDSRGPGRRHEIYPQYKANRPPMDPDLAAQSEPIRALVQALGLFSLERPGFEADDLIAATAREMAGQGREVVIVSSDKDFYQLLTDKISMYDPDPKKDSALTCQAFTERFELAPGQFLDIQALMGDSSDNIPGVPRVGEKTAQKLIAKFGSLDAVYQRLDEVTPEKLRQTLAENKGSAYLSRELAYLGHGATPESDLEALRPKTPDRAALTALFQELDFHRLMKDFGLAGGPAGQAPVAKTGPAASLFDTADEAATQSPKISYDDYLLVDNDEAWAALLDALKKAERLAVDTETDSLSPSRARLVGLSLCAEPGRAFYVPVSHQSLGAKNQPWEKVKELIGPYLEGERPLKIGQNAKFDWLLFSRRGLALPAPKDDPMLAAYLLDPEGRHGLDALSLKHLGHQPISFKSLVPDPKKRNFGDLSPEEASDYAAEDADLTLRLADTLRRALAKTPELERLYEEVELPLENLLAKMEGTGVLLDAGRLAELSGAFGERLKGIEARIFELAGHSFNIGSPKQLAEVLFQEQGFPAGKKTAKKTGYSTDDDVLAELALLYDLPKEVRRWRGLEKLKNTYTDKLPREINPATGRVHTSYNQTQTATGRLSSSDPNLQNIPTKSEEGRLIRSAFIAPPGRVLVSADYSQIELRVLAHFSQDRALMEAFHNDEDLHTRTAAEIFGLAPADITPAQRREAKTINFGIVYGQGAFGLARQLGIPQGLARDFIDKYFQRFPGVRRYMEESKAEAHRSGLVSTWFGRRRFLSALSAGGYQARQEAERMAINTPIQGTAADLIKMAMLAVDRRLAGERPEARLIMQVHDELVVEAPAADAEAVKRILKEEMAGVGQKPPLSQARPLTVPLKVDVSSGPNWSEAH